MLVVAVLLVASANEASYSTFSVGDALDDAVVNSSGDLTHQAANGDCTELDSGRFRCDKLYAATDGLVADGVMVDNGSGVYEVDVGDDGCFTAEHVSGDDETGLSGVPLPDYVEGCGIAASGD